jgi:phage terminase large subunit GpA-like protein
MIGVDEGKFHVYSYLNIQEPGAGYCHFKDGMNDATYFDMLTAEQWQKEETKRGTQYVWSKKRNDNEALDCRVYALAALHDIDPNWQRLERQLAEATERVKGRPPSTPTLQPASALPPPLVEALPSKASAPASGLQRRPLRFGGR